MNTVQLEPLQIRSLLWAIETKQLVSIRTEDSSTEANGLLLGGDFINNELLLCDTHPDITTLIVNGGERSSYWLQVKSAQSYIRLLVTITNIYKGLITAKIISAATTSNKRWNDRLEYPPLQGPQTRINREFEPNIMAKTRNLSVRGAAIDIWGKELNRVCQPGQTIATSINFNRHFELNVDCFILSSQFHRLPSCHTRLRVLFKDLNRIGQGQLTHLIDVAQLSFAAA